MSGERNRVGRLAPMALAALVVVFGDIGTSRCIPADLLHRAQYRVTPGHIFGVLSLIFWSLVLVILLSMGCRVERRHKGEGAYSR